MKYTTASPGSIPNHAEEAAHHILKSKGGKKNTLLDITKISITQSISNEHGRNLFRTHKKETKKLGLFSNANYMQISKSNTQNFKQFFKIKC